MFTIALAGALTSLHSWANAGNQKTQPLPDFVKTSCTALVHRPSTASERERLNAFREGMAITSSRSGNVIDAINAYAEAVGKTERIPAQAEFSLLTVGPLLDSIDDVAVRGIEREGNQIHLQLDFTSARAQDVKLRRNIQWRPLVEVRCKLSRGKYVLQLIWNAVHSATRQPLNLPTMQKEYPFEIGLN